MTDSPIVASPSRTTVQRSAISFAPSGVIARLRRHDGGTLGISLRCEVTPIRAEIPRPVFQARMVGYGYHILDAQGRELLAFHWHPEGISPVADPHLHITTRIGRVDAPGSGSRIAIGEMHIPTGFVSVSQTVRLLIDEFDVEPRREDWRSVLDSVHPLDTSGAE